jgi:diaminopimelate epimerase
MRFSKYHALGNDYLVLDPKDAPEALSDDAIKTICHRNYGLGSDGILYGPLNSSAAQFKLRIFNPDASEAEKSGNGLRIFCRYLFDQGLVEQGSPFTVDTLGGIVEATILEKGAQVRVSMGRAVFEASRIPVVSDHPNEPFIEQNIDALGKQWRASCVSVGNPHCVIPMEAPTPELAKELGPVVEHLSIFPNRINMQLLKVIDRKNIQIEIWERGAGYTLASGTSSCAASTIAHRLGLCDDDITVHAPGGKLSIRISEGYALTMTGPVTQVGRFELSQEALA